MQVKLGSNFIKVKINQYLMSVIRPPQTVPPPPVYPVIQRNENCHCRHIPIVLLVMKKLD